MFDKKLMVMLFLIFIIITWFILFKMINYKVENFVDGSSDDITYDLLMKNYKMGLRNNVSDNLKNYFSLYQTIIQQDMNNEVYFNIYSSCINKDYGSDSIMANDNYLLYLFTNSDLNNFITFNNNNKTVINNQLKNYFVININNNIYDSLDFYINNINIAINSSAFSDYNRSSNIKFYYAASTNDTINPGTMSYSELKPNGFTTDLKNNVIIFKYTFSQPLLNNIIINVNSTYLNRVNVDEFNLYYINIYGLSKGKYDKLLADKLNQISNASNISKMTGGDIDTSSAQDANDNLYNSGNSNKDITNFTSDILSNKFKMIINNKVPWGVYNGEDYLLKTGTSGKVGILPDLLGRKCRDAIITDPNNELNNAISTEDTYYVGYDINGNKSATPIKSNIRHLKGSTNMYITFPVGSLPQNYTICAVTRYTNNLSCGRIVTGKTCCYPINFLVGHWANNKNIVYNMGWKGRLGDPGDTNWIVSCIKRKGNLSNQIDDTEIDSRFKNKYNTIILNGKSSGFESDIGALYANTEKDPNYVLTVNGLQSEASNFGLAYLLIWDQILTDGELEIMSKNLINSIYDISYKLPLKDIIINIPNDGLTVSSAANNASLIKTQSCNNLDDYYWININGRIKKIFCILNDDISSVYKGGWMLAMKGAKNTNTFNYNSSYWTDRNSTLNENMYIKNILDNTSVEMKTDIFNYYNFTEVLVIYNDPTLLNADGNNNYYLRSYYKLQNDAFKGSLADFFAGNYTDFVYGNSAEKVLATNQINNYNSKSVYQKIPFNKIDSFLTQPEGFNFKNYIFTQQGGFKTFGLNLNFYSWIPFYWSNSTHYVRIGAAYNNENFDMQSIDVSNGIGLSLGFASGNVVNCCQSSGPGNSTSYPFLLFVR